MKPRLLEVLSGVGLGVFWLVESQTLFLSGWASPPDLGVSRAFELLGFQVVEEAESDGAPMPAHALARQLDEGPVILGPLDMGELPYHPDSRGANGVDHFVLALDVGDGAIVVHDPAGYPATPIAIEALDRAWRAEMIGYRRGPYRRFHSPTRIRRPAQEEVAAAAVQSFAQAYSDSRATVPSAIVVGPDAIEALVATIRSRQLSDRGLEHLRRFALPLGTRRALDYAWFLRDLAPRLADLKSRQAWHLGCAQAAAARCRWEPLAEQLTHLAGLEHDMEAALSASKSDGP